MDMDVDAARSFVLLKGMYSCTVVSGSYVTSLSRSSH